MSARASNLQAVAVTLERCPPIPHINEMSEKTSRPVVLRRGMIVVGAAVYTVLLSDAQAAGWIDVPGNLDTARVCLATTSKSLVHGAPAFILVNRGSDLEPDFGFALPPKPIKLTGENK